MSASRASSSEAKSRFRYCLARSRSASSDFPDSGSNRVLRAPSSSSGGSTDFGREMATGRAGPTGKYSSSLLFGVPYPATMTCAFVPDHPNEFTPAIGGRSALSGQSVASEVTRRGSRSQSMFGLGFSKCRCFGITPCFIESTVLIRPAIPAVGSR